MLHRLRTLGLVVAAVLLAACTSSPAQDAAPTLRGCDEVACAGSLAGAPYQILLPKTWNGTLLLYSHGYRAAQPVPPDFAPVDTAPEPAPSWSGGDHEVGQALLDKGYALAGSAYSSNGWAVQEGVQAGTDLYTYFRDNVGVPDRVYVWGDSLGGLVSAELAETHPDWVSGAAPLCGVLAGLNPNMDLALDVAYAVKVLLAPDLRLTGYASYQDAIRGLEAAGKKVLAAAADRNGDGAATVLFIAALADAPAQTQRFDGSTPHSRLGAATEGVLTALAFGTYARYDIERRVGGNPSSNAGTDYAARISAADVKRIDAVSPGAAQRFLRRLDAGERISADPAARTAAAAELGDPQGTLARPMVSLHTLADPLVLSANEWWYAQRVQRAGAQRDLAQLLTVPPATYAEQPGAPYGAGHCSFTAASRVGVISVLDDWVRGGHVPTASSVAEALGPGSGYDPTAVAPPWPAGGDSPSG